jgi:hypothetical protein
MELTLQTTELLLAICELPPDAVLPDWLHEEGFCSVTRTGEELSIVCPQERVPSEVTAEREWRAIRVKGPLDFSLTGILSALLVPLAREGISVFTLSTYRTDYLLIKADRFKEALHILGSLCTIEKTI